MTTRRRRPVWDAGRVRALRRHLGLSQNALAEELGVRQQTVSEWETGQYRPRGASARLLALVAERADFPYQVEGSGVKGEGAEGGGGGRGGSQHSSEARQVGS